MAFTIKKNKKFAVSEESTEGTYQAPANADFIKAQPDGLNISPSKETLEQDTLGSGLTMEASQQGLESVTGACNVYMKPNGTEGAAPEYGILLESGLGGARSSSAITSNSSSDNTTTRIFVADTSNHKVGDIIVIKEAGAFHYTPITAISADTYIDFLVPMDAAPADNAEIAAFTTYFPTNSGHKSYSATLYVEDEVKETSAGNKTKSWSIGNFVTGQNAVWNFTFEGSDFDRKLETITATPSYDTAKPPVILKACIYQNGNKVKANEFTLAGENTIGWITDTCEGKSNSRVTARAITGTINPYKKTDDLTDYNNFNTNTEFSLFVEAKIPTGVAGEYKDYVGFWIPRCQITELGEGDVDGNLTNTISFKAVGDADNQECFISFS